MSKKRNRKFKKAKTHQSVVAPAALSRTVESAGAEPDSGVGETRTEVSPEIADPMTTLDTSPQYLAIRREVKKVLFIIGILFLVLIASYFINDQTTTFSSVGNWLYRTANIQTQ
ncbi:MAG: hypothetical protein AAB360_02955 [Patescibacteria group bacterium]